MYRTGDKFSNQVLLYFIIQANELIIDHKAGKIIRLVAFVRQCKLLCCRQIQIYANITIPIHHGDRALGQKDCLIQNVRGASMVGRFHFL